jgi:hypothetical protein
LHRPTVGANAAQDGIVTIGVAAHICAASAGGPRYDPLQTPEQRRGKENGIWLCQNCGKLIDSDEAKFTEEVLRRWKRDAQERALRELVAPGLSAPTGETARFSSIIAADHASSSDAELDRLFAAILAAAEADIDAYMPPKCADHPDVVDRKYSPGAKRGRCGGKALKTRRAAG